MGGTPDLLGRRDWWIAVGAELLKGDLKITAPQHLKNTQAKTTYPQTKSSPLSSVSGIHSPLKTRGELLITAKETFLYL